MFAKVAAKNYAPVKVSFIEAERNEVFSEGAFVKQCRRYVNTYECLLAIIFATLLLSQLVIKH